MPATVQVDLSSPVDDLPVGKIAARLAAGDRPVDIPIQMEERGSFFALDGQQVREEPGVSPAGEEQVGVVSLQVGVQPD